MLRLAIRTATIAGAIVAAACVYDAPVTPHDTNISAATVSTGPSLQIAATATAEPGGRYLIVFNPGRSAAAAIATELSTNGGHLEGLHEQLGFAVVSGITSEAAGRLAKADGVGSVEADIEFALESPSQAEALDASDLGTQSAESPQTAFFFVRQWNMRAIRADAAWAGGALGSPNVSVAILDTGIDYRWPDLNGRVDLARSISMRPDEDARLHTWFGALNLNPITDLNGHGTIVSSIVASNSNYFAGVTTRTTLFGVKVCTVFNTCSTLATLNGILYAADHGADVINMSLGGAFPKSAAPGLVSIFSRVLNYANRRGTLIVVAAGNEAADLDHNGNIYSLYCNSPHVVCVSATGPTATPTPVGPFTNPDAVTPYTNYGRSAVSLAAPGGGITSSNVLVSGPCSQTALVWHQPPPPTPGAPLPPPVIDAPRCPESGGLFRLSDAGTSFSAPHVAGVAAALVAMMGPGNPSQIRARLQSSSDDLGAPGTDPFYGHGRLNAGRAVGALP